MKQFLIKTGLFLCIPIALCLLLLFGFYFANNSIYNSFRVNPNVTTVFLGDSHVQQAVDDKKIKNSLNLAQNSEAYYFTYFKLKKLIENNSSVKKVYLGFSYHSLSVYYEDYIFGNHSKDISTRYFNVLPYSEKIRLLEYNSDGLPIYFKNLLKNGFKNILQPASKQQFIGYYDNSFVNSKPVKGSMDFRLNFQYYKDGKITEFSNVNIYYLKHIQKLCADNKIELTLINTPLYSYYKNNVPAPFIEKYHSVIKENQFKVIDFDSVKFEEDDFIPDGDHVSVKGTDKVAAYLNQYMQTH